MLRSPELCAACAQLQGRLLDLWRLCAQLAPALLLGEQVQPAECLSRKRRGILLYEKAQLLAGLAARRRCCSSRLCSLLVASRCWPLRLCRQAPGLCRLPLDVSL